MTTPDPTLEDVQVSYMREILDRCDGNRTHAAKILGINQKTLRRWI